MHGSGALVLCSCSRACVWCIWERGDPMYALDDYDYELSEDRIAQKPCEQRDRSRLLHLDRGSGDISHRLFCDLPNLLRSGDVLVVNNTKVIPGRLLGRKGYRRQGRGSDFNLCGWSGRPKIGRRICLHLSDQKFEKIPDRRNDFFRSWTLRRGARAVRRLLRGQVYL